MYTHTCHPPIYLTNTFCARRPRSPQKITSCSEEGNPGRQPSQHTRIRANFPNFPGPRTHESRSPQHAALPRTRHGSLLRPLDRTATSAPRALRVPTGKPQIPGRWVGGVIIEFNKVMKARSEPVLVTAGVNRGALGAISGAGESPKAP